MNNFSNCITCRYELFLPLHKMWLKYMEDLLQLTGSSAEVTKRSAGTVHTYRLILYCYMSVMYFFKLQK